MNALADLLSLGRVFASLVVVIAVAALVARAARRATRHGPGVGLAVLDRVGLSREAALAVVSVGGRALVLGVTARGVTLLTELDAAVLEPPDPLEPPGPLGPDAALAHRTAYQPPRSWRQAIDALRDLTARRAFGSGLPPGRSSGSRTSKAPPR